VHRVYTCAQTKHHTTNQLKNLAQPQPGWAVFAPARARSHLLGLGINCSPHTGHSIRSKSMCRTSAGGINLPHFGQTASSDACTFLRLTSRTRRDRHVIATQDHRSSVPYPARASDLPHRCHVHISGPDLLCRRSSSGGELLRRRLGLGGVWGAFSLYSLSHQFQQFGNDVSPSNLSNQIPEFLMLIRVFGLPVEAIHPINVSQLSLQIF